MTPSRSSPANCKTRRELSPGKSKSRKELFSSGKENNLPTKKDSFEEARRKRAIENVALSKLNIDNLDTSHGSVIKVVTAYPSGNVTVGSNFTDVEKSILSNIC